MELQRRVKTCETVDLMQAQVTALQEQLQTATTVNDNLVHSYQSTRNEVLSLRETNKTLEQANKAT